MVYRRPDWDTYFLQITDLVARRSTCVRRKVGALIVKDNRILASGYNGAPQGLEHCLEVGCLRESMNVPSGTRHELCRGLHAEQNALIQAARYGVSTTGAICYCTTTPCVICAKMLIQAGIKKIVAGSRYPDPLAERLLNEAGIPVELNQVDTTSNKGE